jgi:glutamyl-tRNA reductase
VDLDASDGADSTAAPSRFLEAFLAELWRSMDEIAASELKRAHFRLVDVTRSEREAIETLATRLPRAILHGFVTRLHCAVCTDDRALIEAARFFLGADAPLPEAAMTIWRSNGSELASRGGDG